MRNHLHEMMKLLTSAYTHEDHDSRSLLLPIETNIGKLFSVLAWGLDMAQEQAELVKQWDNLDNAKGAVLDRYGANFGVRRGGANDTFYRLVIKVKMIALLSGGDIDTVTQAAASLFNVEISDIELQEIFPAKVWMFIEESMLDNERMESIELIAELMKRIIAAGVGMRIFLRTKRTAREDLYIGMAAIEGRNIEADLRPDPGRTSRMELDMVSTAFEDITIKGDLMTRDVTVRDSVKLSAVTVAWEFTEVNADIPLKPENRSGGISMVTGSTVWEEITIIAGMPPKQEKRMAAISPAAGSTVWEDITVKANIRR